MFDVDVRKKSNFNQNSTKKKHSHFDKKTKTIFAVCHRSSAGPWLGVGGFGGGGDAGGHQRFGLYDPDGPDAWTPGRDHRGDADHRICGPCAEHRPGAITETICKEGKTP